MTGKELVAAARARRILEGYSIRALGRHIGVAFSTLARLERGTGLPDQSTAMRLRIYVEKGDPVAPRVFAESERRESWWAKVEKRLGVVEDELATLRRRVDGD